MALFDRLIEIEDVLLRNTNAARIHKNVFDDLSDQPTDWKEAEKISKENHHDVELYAIGYVFKRERWLPSRFSDGSFPVWYGSLDVDTTFHETIFHWRDNLLADADFLDKEFPIYAVRRVFQVECHSSLVDIRSKVTEYPFLTEKNRSCYEQTQPIGIKCVKDGLPGLLSLSARTPQVGTNAAIFNQKCLSKPAYFNDYLYELLPNNQHMVRVKNYATGELITTI